MLLVEQAVAPQSDHLARKLLLTISLASLRLPPICSIKTSVLHDYLCHKDIDICAITKSWFKTKDTVARAECTPPGYTIKNHSRSGRAGGGIALIYKSTLSLVKVAASEKTSFQFVEYTIFSDLRSGADKIKLLLIYRPPYSTAHRVTVATFLDEFPNYLEPIILSPEPLVITGDMNIHVDDPNDPDAIKFLDLLNTYGLTQHINTHTHRLGHTLDLIITHVSDTLAWRRGTGALRNAFGELQS